MSLWARRRLSYTESLMKTALSSLMRRSPVWARLCRDAGARSPARKISPARGASSPAKASRAVVLPAPLGPSRATTSPGLTARVKSARTETGP